MFTAQQIEKAHAKVKTGADFPKYIQEIKALGVEAFETWVKDSRTVYFGKENFQTASLPKYDDLEISENTHAEEFKTKLKDHQQGKTDYFAFCKDCAETGIEKWIVDLHAMTCIYYDLAGKEILIERIPE